MVTLYTWGPATAEAVLENTVAPDLGHSALEVKEKDGTTKVYASFWPERDSLIGRVRNLLHRRPHRNPESYAQETDPDGAFMQRPADHADEITGLEESVIVELWQKLQGSEYDFFHWNCASVCKLLILSALPLPLHASLQSVTGDVPKTLAHLRDVEDLQAAMRELSASPFIDSHPEELRQIAEAYLKAAQDVTVSSSS